MLCLRSFAARLSHVILQMGMGRHADGTAGGMNVLRSEMAAEQRAHFKGSAGKLKNVWMPAYDREAEQATGVDEMLGY